MSKKVLELTNVVREETTNDVVDVDRISDALNGITLASEHSEMVLEKGYNAFSRNQSVLIENIAKATQAAPFAPGKSFTKEHATDIAAQGTALPGKRIETLTSPEAWSKSVLPSDHRLEDDIQSGATMKADYQIAPVTLVESDEETGTSNSGKKKEHTHYLAQLFQWQMHLRRERRMDRAWEHISQWYK